MPEGTVFFANEPILRITAPLPEAQLIETRLLNVLHFQSLIASKAARMVQLAPSKLLVDFGLRRAHGAEAGLMAARASGLPRRSDRKGDVARRKQVWRRYGSNGRMASDILSVEDDQQDGKPLIQPLVIGGRCVGPRPSLDDIRAHAREELSRLPPELEMLSPLTRYTPRVAPSLERLAAAVDSRTSG